MGDGLLLLANVTKFETAVRKPENPHDEEVEAVVEAGEAVVEAGVGVKEGNQDADVD